MTKPIVEPCGCCGDFIYLTVEAYCRCCCCGQVYCNPYHDPCFMDHVIHVCPERLGCRQDYVEGIDYERAG